MSHGLAVGKFYPPHAGHHKLINTMLEECGFATVALCYSKVENIDPITRKRWLEDTHGEDLQVILVEDNSPVEYTDETWELFLDALMESLDWSENGYPDTIYSGEDYAPEFARRLDERYDRRVFRHHPASNFPKAVGYRMFDRSEMPGVSATAIRNNPVDNWELLAPATRADLCKRVVVCGAESSGTTTLAKELQTAYQTTVVPEYGRHFDWAVGLRHKWVAEDFFHISRMQKQWEDELARRSKRGLLICDTDEFATAMFAELYLDGQELRRVGNNILIDAEESEADLYIITDHRGVEFEQDGSRVNGPKRPWMTDWFMRNLPEDKTVLVNGDRERRFAQASRAITDMLEEGWSIEPPIEQREGYREQWEAAR